MERNGLPSLHETGDSSKEVMEKSGSESKTGRDWRKICILLSLAYNQFWAASCYSIQAPFFPKEAEMKGATPKEYGMVFSVYEIALIIASPIYGRLVPTVSPKFLLTAGVFLEGGACALFGVLEYAPAGTTYIAMAFIVRIVEGLGGAAFVTGSFTFIASEFSSSVGKTFSLMETTFGVGLIAGPTVGGVLYQAGGFIVPFVVSGGLQLLGAILLMIFIPPINEAERRSTENMKKFLLDPEIELHMLAIITTFLLIGFNAGTLEPHLREFDLSAAILGVIFVITGGIYALTTPVFGWLADKGASSLLVISLGYCVTAFGIFFIGPVPFLPFDTKLWTVILSLIIIGLGMAAKLVPAFTGTVKRITVIGYPDNLATYGMVSGCFSFACSLGAFIGPSLGGFLLDTIGYDSGTLVLLGIELISLLLVLIFLARKKRKSTELGEDSSLLVDETRRYSTTVNQP